MKKVLFILFQLGALVGQSSSFDLFDVIVYSEYYFDGIMAEVDGEVKAESLPLNFEMGVPANTDSVFFVSGSADSEAEVKHLSVLNTNNRSFIQVSVLESKFRIFIFYPIEKNGTNRSGEFNLEINVRKGFKITIPLINPLKRNDWSHFIIVWGIDFCIHH